MTQINHLDYPQFVCDKFQLMNKAKSHCLFDGFNKSPYVTKWEIRPMRLFKVVLQRFSFTMVHRFN